MNKFFRILIGVLLFAGSALPAVAQVKLGNNPATINNSAILEMETTTKALLLPRMLQSQMMSIASPAAGLVVYCTNCTPVGLRFYDGTSWGAVGANNLPPATFATGSLSCAGTLGGNYFAGSATNSSNTKEILITANTGGSYTASTNTVNGVSFAAAGNLLSVGGGTPVTLQATGTPLAAGTFSYTATLGGQACSFSVNFIDRATFACANTTSAFTPGGSLVNGTSYSGTYTLPYATGSGAAYGVATFTKNGLSLTRTAGTYAAGGGSVVYTLSGTYTGSTPFVAFNVSEGCAVGIPSNYVSTLAGLAGISGSADGTGSAARFSVPLGIATDVAGNVYVTDIGNNTIRKVTPAGAVTTLAGSAGTAGSADGTGSAARFDEPAGIALDAAGNVYVADYFNHVIRKITPAGVVTTFAGSAGNSGSIDGPVGTARFHFPTGVAIDAADNMYIINRGSTIRKISSANMVTTLAGSTNLYGSTDGTGSAARFQNPSYLSVEAAGTVYVSDAGNNTIRKITPAGVVTTFAGSAGTTGSANGTGSAARFSNPSGITVDADGNLILSDQSNHTIRKVTPTGGVTTFAGSAGVSGSANGSGSAARFNNPGGITIDAAGNIYIADRFNHTIRKITP